jgi:hypothetical protein
MYIEECCKYLNWRYITDHIESTDVSITGLGRRPDMRTINSKVHTFKLSQKYLASKEL